jgi:pyrimidine deaminase RibD-like protein
MPEDLSALDRLKALAEAIETWQRLAVTCRGIASMPHPQFPVSSPRHPWELLEWQEGNSRLLTGGVPLSPEDAAVLRERERDRAALYTVAREITAAMDAHAEWAEECLEQVGLTSLPLIKLRQERDPRHLPAVADLLVRAQAKLRAMAARGDERNFMDMAIEEARQSVGEDGRAHPKVGAVVVKGGKVLATAHRGELKEGEHAEFTALERKLRTEIVAGATVYTTLEPCTTRNHPKIPCADRLIDRKVKRVVIGMLDPNPAICGRGERLLRKHGIVVDRFPHDLILQLEELNRDFVRAQS